MRCNTFVSFLGARGSHQTGMDADCRCSLVGSHDLTFGSPTVKKVRAAWAHGSASLFAFLWPPMAFRSKTFRAGAIGDAPGLGDDVGVLAVPVGGNLPSGHGRDILTGIWLLLAQIGAILRAGVGR